LVQLRGKYLLDGERARRQRRMWRAIAFAACCLIAGGLLYLQAQRADGTGRPVSETVAALVEKLRGQVISGVAPLQQAVGVPGRVAASAAQRWSQLFGEADDMETLRAKAAEVEGWKMRVRDLEDRLSELGALAEVVTEPQIDFVTTEVIAADGAPGGRGLVIGAGQDNGVEPGHPVIGARGFVGVVRQAGPRAARVRLIIDPGFEAEVMVGRSRVRGALRSSGRNRLELDLPPWVPTIAEGDEVLTSGDASTLPRGLRVGRVVRREEGGLAVQPFVDFDALVYLSVLRFKAPRTGDATAQPDKKASLSQLPSGIAVRP